MGFGRVKQAVGSGILGGALICLMWAMAFPCFAASEPAGSAQPGFPEGAPIFEIHCAGCHPRGGNIIRRGKTLKMNALKQHHMDSVEAIAHIVTVGKSPMSAYQDTLSADDIQAVSAYVLERAAHDWK